VCLLLVSSTPAFALDPHKQLSQFGHRVWTRDQGLPQDSIRSIAQAADGALWVGTEEGLARYDGTEFTVFGRAPGQLRNATVTALLGTRDGAMYVGTLEGLFRYRDGAFHSFVTAGVGARVIGLVEDGEGVVWATDGRSAFAIQGDAVRTYTTSDGLSPHGIRHLRVSRTGGLLAIGARDVAAWRGGRFVVEGFDVAAAAAPSRSRAPRSEVERHWVWSGDHVAALERRDGRVAVAAVQPATFVRAVLEDRDGTVWIGTSGGLLRGIEGVVTAVNVPTFPDLTIIWQLFEDRDGTLWVGTNAGLHEFRELRVAVFGRGEGFPSDQPTVVHEGRDDALWIGFENAGLLRVAGDVRQRITQAQGLPGDRVFSLRATRTGDLLVATDHGLALVADGRATPVDVLPPDVDAVFDAIEDGQGRRWLATDHGVYLVDGASVTRVIASQGGLSGTPTTLALTPDGALWAGTHRSGLWRYKDGRTTTFTTRDGLPSDAVRALHADREGVLWIGTLGGGLAWWRAGTFGRVSLAPAGGDNVGQLVPAADGTLWVGTSTGIVHVDTAAALAGRPTVRGAVQGTADGLRSSQCAPAFPTARGGTLDRAGRLWMITANGLARVDARRAQPLPRPGPARLRAVFVNGEPTDPERDLDLAPSVSRVTFRFTSTYLYAPERVRYRYRLEGVDRDWIDAGTRRAADYMNLPPGRYRFLVAARVGDDEAAPAALVVRQRAAWYASVWFPVVLVVALAGLGGAAYAWRLRQLRKRFALVLTERSRISRDLHDTLAQGLVGISTQLGGVTASLRQEPEVAEQRLTLARRMVQHSLTEARRSIMDLRDPVLDGRTLHDAIHQVAAQLTAGSGVTMTLTDEGYTRPTDASARQHLVRIAQEAVHNAMKHAEPRNIRIRIGPPPRLLIVEDDGAGFDAQEARAMEEGRFGLLGMGERARLIGGALRTESRPGQGTTIAVEWQARD